MDESMLSWIIGSIICLFLYLIVNAIDKAYQNNTFKGLNLKDYLNKYLEKNPQWLNNEITRKNGNEKFKYQLSKEINGLLKNTKLVLYKVYNYKGENYAILEHPIYNIKLTIICKLQNSVNINNLCVNEKYKIVNGDFNDFILFNPICEWDYNGNLIKTHSHELYQTFHYLSENSYCWDKFGIGIGSPNYYHFGCLYFENAIIKFTI